MAIGGGQNMGGLLGGDFNDPRTQGILGLSAGLLAGGAPSVGKPVSLGGALGQGLMMGQNAFNKAQARQDKLNQGKFQVVGGSLLDLSDPSNPKVVYQQPKKMESGLLGDGKYTYTKDKDGKIKIEKSDVYDDIISLEAKKKTNKPLSTSAQKAEDEDFGAIDISNNILAETQGFLDKIESGDLTFRPLSGVSDSIALAAGSSDEGILNRQSFELFLKRLTNASLRLNKGTQTEGDAERALKEIVNNKSNTKVVQRALQDLQRANKRAAEERKRNINRRRKTQGVGSFDFSDYSTPITNDDVGFKVID